jgi:hypothetical protein
MVISKSDHEKAVADARAEGAASELARIKSILTAPEANGRERSAIGLALQPGLTLEIAQSVLDTSDFGRGREIARSLRR